LERSPLVTKAMLAAMSSTEEAATPLKYEIDTTLRAIIADVVDDGHCATLPDLDGVVRVLGSVWFAELTYWSNGLNPTSSMGDNLASAAQLLLG
jgi:hypothetical protein